MATVGVKGLTDVYVALVSVPCGPGTYYDTVADRCFSCPSGTSQVDQARTVCLWTTSRRTQASKTNSSQKRWSYFCLYCCCTSEQILWPICWVRRRSGNWNEPYPADVGVAALDWRSHPKMLRINDVIWSHLGRKNFRHFCQFLVTARCYAERGIAMAKLPVCLSVIKYVVIYGKIIPRLILSVVFSVCTDHNIMDLLQREHHGNFGWNRDTADDITYRVVQKNRDHFVLRPITLEIFNRSLPNLA